MPGSSVVEHVPEEHSVDGSIPSPGTIFFIFSLYFVLFYQYSFFLKSNVLALITWCY